MYQHRIVFVTTWLVLAIALVKHPSPGAHGFVLGMLVGLWPLLLLSDVLPVFGSTVTAIGALVLSAGAVALCAWSADAARLSKQLWFFLFVAVMVGGAVSCALTDYSFENWRNSPAIFAATEAGGLDFEPTHEEYHSSVTIPKALAGSIWGLYVFAAMTLFASLVERFCLNGEGGRSPPYDTRHPANS